MAKNKEVKTNAMRILEKNKIEFKHYTYECDEFVDALQIADMLQLPYEKVYKTLVTIVFVCGYSVNVIRRLFNAVYIDNARYFKIHSDYRIAILQGFYIVKKQIKQHSVKLTAVTKSVFIKLFTLLSFCHMPSFLVQMYFGKMISGLYESFDLRSPSIPKSSSRFIYL